MKISEVSRAENAIESIGGLFERGRPLIFDTCGLIYHPISKCPNLVWLTNHVSHPNELEKYGDLILAHEVYTKRISSLFGRYSNFFVVGEVGLEYKNGNSRLEEGVGVFNSHRILNKKKKGFNQYTETLKRISKYEKSSREKHNARGLDAQEGFDKECFEKICGCLDKFGKGFGIKENGGENGSKADEQVAAFAIYLASMHGKNPIVLSNDKHVRRLIEIFKGVVYLDQRVSHDKLGPFFRLKVKVDLFNCLDGDGEYLGGLTKVGDIGVGEESKRWLVKEICELSEFLKNRKK